MKRFFQNNNCLSENLSKYCPIRILRYKKNKKFIIKRFVYIYIWLMIYMIDMMQTMNGSNAENIPNISLKVLPHVSGPRPGGLWSPKQGSPILMFSWTAKQLLYYYYYIIIILLLLYYCYYIYYYYYYYYIITTTCLLHYYYYYYYRAHHINK